MNNRINKGKKVKSKLVEIGSESGSDSEHELFHYSKDRIQLMKEVLKLIKPKKIKAMAPDCLKKADCEEINSMLLEELLGISNKRLKKIFDGQNVEDASSSSEEDDKPISIISLDDISDSEDDLLTGGTSAPKNNKKHKCKKHRSHKIKTEPKSSEIKQERTEKSKNTKTKENKHKESTTGENDKVLSVLELLELQARARAIRSQLALEAESRAKAVQAITDAPQDDSDDDAVALIVEDPKNNEIVISSSEEENKKNHVRKSKIGKSLNGSIGKKKQKVKLVRLRYSGEKSQENNQTSVASETVDNVVASISLKANNTENSDKQIEDILDVQKDNVDNIPLPSNESENLRTINTSNDNTLDTTSKKNILENSDNVIECSKEKQNKVFVIDEQIITKGSAKNSNICLDNNKVLSSDLIEDSKSSVSENVEVSKNKSESENDDVINLDFVEIDGIDD